MANEPMSSIFQRWVRRSKADPPMRRAPGRRIVLDAEPAAIYAVGDVHGCLSLLKDIEAQIVADAARVAGKKWLIMLGDYVDRGPKSAQVIDHLREPPPAGVKRFCLAGNHETKMSDFLGDPAGNADWLELGGRDTLASYGISALDVDGARLGGRAFRSLLASHIPDEHEAFLLGLPIAIETPNYFFVHAGLRSGTSLERQTDHDLLWIADNFAADFAEFDKIVVHGHQTRPDPLISPRRIAVDTGAYATGRLSAVRLESGVAPQIFTATGSPV